VTSVRSGAPAYEPLGGVGRDESTNVVVRTPTAYLPVAAQCSLWYAHGDAPATRAAISASANPRRSVTVSC